MVGPTTEYLESCEGGVIESKHDIHRILSQHSYAHPYTEDTSTTNVQDVDVKHEHILSTELSDGDKGDVFYTSVEDANDCVTIEVPCEEQLSVEEIKPLTVETEFDIANDLALDSEMKLLSPMSLSPQASEDNFLAVSPAHTFNSDLGYESLPSPFSDPESIDLPDFWCDSFSELFPGLV
ncbi:hypothetical protein EVAR_74951_1 [Eumeta japonica]|uniref:Uncharacterized protein n=1 Tax=Eumeta variegata TaxID=151549 RepID=A0A4C1UIN5_EUMVA|nr:hypothetical protein EVAR_74951_1 [Eumeta japonica]